MVIEVSSVLEFSDHSNDLCLSLAVKVQLRAEFSQPIYIYQTFKNGKLGTDCSSLKELHTLKQRNTERQRSISILYLSTEKDLQEWQNIQF